MLTKGVENQTRLVGETARFTCEFLSDMHPYIYWMYFSKDEYLYEESDTSQSLVSNETVANNKPIMVRVVLILGLHVVNVAWFTYFTFKVISLKFGRNTQARKISVINDKRSMK